MSINTIIVVPLYNEFNRFQTRVFDEFLARTELIGFVFVDDGSTDNLFEILTSLKDKYPDRLELIKHAANKGKAEAVRSGVLKALDMEPAYIGYWDADLATPLDLIPDFIDVFAKRDCLLLLGSRVKIAGKHIERNPLRHIMGRVFATLVSRILNLGIYDTQCGAKLMTQEVASYCFADPFTSRWCFDVEIIMRFLHQYPHDNVNETNSRIIELPLTYWVDNGETRIKFIELPMMLIDLFKISRRYN